MNVERSFNNVFCDEEDNDGQENVSRHQNRFHRLNRNRSKHRQEPNYLLQPELALSLFFEPTKSSLWNESLRWKIDKILARNDEVAKALALDYRSSLINARKCILSNKSLLPEVNSINNNFKSLKKNNPTFVDFRDDSPVKNITLLTKKPTEPQKKITLLKRPTPAPQPVEEPSTSVSPTTTTLSNDQEVVELLQKFANNLDETVFKKALDRCKTTAQYVYTAVTEMVNSKNKPPEFKPSIFKTFASTMEKMYLLKLDHIKNSPDFSKLSLNDKETSESQEFIKTFAKCYKTFILEIRRIHTKFIDDLVKVVPDFDINLLLPRDLSSQRLGLIKFRNRSQGENGKFHLLKDFLYVEFMTLGFIELALQKTFKVKEDKVKSDSVFSSDLLHPAMLFFVNAAIMEPSKSSPYVAMRNACSECSMLEINLLAFHSYMKDAHSRVTMVELRNLSRLYTDFYPVFAASYDDIFNANCRQWSPIKSNCKQRWLVPDGVNDPTFDSDAAVRLSRNLHKYTFENQEKEFKFYFFWSGVRLLTFIGYKILNNLDMDSFEESILIAIGGLAIGISSGIADLSHLTLLARFLISVATFAYDSEKSDGKRHLRTACRLIVEYLAVLTKHLNIAFGNKEELVDNVLKGELDVNLLEFLIPVMILTHWMSESNFFFEVEVWQRKWCLDTNLLEDLWPQLATLGNKVGRILDEGLYKYIRTATSEDEYVFLIPEFVNSYGCSPVFDQTGPKFVAALDERKLPSMDVEVDIRLYHLSRVMMKLANRGNYFINKRGVFTGKSDAMRVLLPEPEYIDVPSMLPVSLTEIVECVERRRTEVPKEQSQELKRLIDLAEAQEAEQGDEDEDSLNVKNIVVVVKPQYVVIDTNVFIDALGHVMELIKDSALTIAIPTPVISELRGLTRRTASTTNYKANAKEVSDMATKTIHYLETVRNKNVKILLCSGALVDFDASYYEKLDETNNDRLIIDAARNLSDKVSGRSHKVPCGEIWIYRNVLLLSKDRVMMLLASAHRLPSLDIFTFSRWAGFRKPALVSPVP